MFVPLRGLCAAATTLIVTASVAPAAAGAATAPTPTGLAGNAAATDVPVPAAAAQVDTSRPTRVVGNGTRASCTSAAVVSAVAAGGIIRFSCGPDPVTIVMTQTAKVRNDHGPDVVLDGRGKVTLSGGGVRRILYMNTCDPAQVWTTPNCDNQSTPRLTVQNINFVDGNSTGQVTDGGGGGAIFVRGGRFKAHTVKFQRNKCERTGPDVGGAAIRVLNQYQNLPVYVVKGTFGGAAGQGGGCSNGGAISSIGVSWVILNSLMSHNSAVGTGANPAKPGTPGGGSGGAIYTDGNAFTVRVGGTRILDNITNEGGGAIFFVSNDRTGTLSIDSSTLRRNRSGQFETAGYPGIFFLGAGRPQVTNSVIG